VTALAATLGTPAKIFAWVHDNIDWESYSGIAKGSLGTLQERRGNDWDQATLLRDLLSARGYNAQLETGTTNGPMSIGFPITVVGRSLQQRITTTLGDGGPTLLAPVKVERHREADHQVVVGAGHVPLATQVEHGIRPQAGLAEPALRSIRIS